MKIWQIKTNFIFIALIILSACSSNEEIFTDDLKINGPDPALLEFSESGMMAVKMKDENTISGFTQDFRFSSSNYFSSFNKINAGIGFNKVLHEGPENVVLFNYNVNTFHLSISDITFSSNSHTYSTRFTLNPRETKKIGEYYYSGDVKYRDGYFLTKDAGWIIAKYERSSNGPDQNQFPDGIRVYRVTGNNCTQINVIEGRNNVPVDIYFKNESEGFIIASDSFTKGTGSIFKTLDGGIHWTKIKALDRTPKSIILVDSENIALATEQGFYQSSDNGTTWSHFDLKVYVMDASVTQEGILYASVQDQSNSSDNVEVISSLYSSHDKGKSWEKVEGKLFYGRNISFFNKEIGIAYTTKVLQYTRDGGKNWHLLIYPYKIE